MITLPLTFHGVGFRCIVLWSMVLAGGLSAAASCRVAVAESLVDLSDWPRRPINESRNDAVRRPAYQRVPAAALPVAASASVRTNVPNEQGIVHVSYEIPAEIQPATLPLMLPVGPCEPWWFEAEYLYWWVKPMKNTPPLVTTSDAADGGIIGSPSNEVLFPTDSLFQSPGSGGRIRFGRWWNTEHSQGIHADLWGLHGPREQFRVDSNGSPLVARPFFDTSTGTQNAEIVATTLGQPRSGGVAIRAGSDLYSAGIGWRWQLGALRPSRAKPCRVADGRFRYLPRGDIRLDFTCGYRYARLGEQLSVFESISIPAGSTPVPAGEYNVQDHFKTTNDFNGVELGLHYQHHHCRWFVDLRPRLAFGNVRQQIEIDGSTRYAPTTGAAINESGGLLALAGTNIGNTTRDQFSFMPQLDLELGYRFSDRLAMTVGYSFLYWMRVARPGEQIDFNVNPNHFPTSNPFAPPSGGPPFDPSPQNADAAFWAQGLNFGFEYRF